MMTDASLAMTSPDIREAVGVFSSLTSFEEAVDELESSGFDPSQLSVLASQATTGGGYRRRALNVTKFEDDPDVPRGLYVPRESIGDLQGALIGALVYICSVIAAITLGAAGDDASTLVTVTATLACGIAGGIIGWVLSRLVTHHYKAYVERQISGGGLVLWVRTWTGGDETRALKILNGAKARHVHVHQFPARTRVVDA